VHGNAKESMNDIFFSKNSCHFSHPSHVTLKAIKQAQTFEVDIVTLTSHTSHALQPLENQNVVGNWNKIRQ
jgi:phosphoheptose isomerase